MLPAPIFIPVLSAPGDRPVIDWNFALTKALDPRITFTRASSGSYVDEIGTIQTASTNVPRFDHDPVTKACRGLLIEEARTNLLLNSSSLATQDVGVSAVAYTLSFYGTGTVTLSGASTAGPLVGTGAGDRVTLTFTPSAGTLTLTVSGTVSNAQLEAGAFATSYIATAGASATRAADVAEDLNPAYYNPVQGTWYAEFRSQTTFARALSIGGNALIATGSDFGQIRPAGSAAGVVGVPDYRTNIVKAAVSYPVANGAGFRLAANGLLGDASNTAAIPAIGALRIGGGTGGGGNAFVSAGVARVRYWPRRLPDSMLRALTNL